MINNAVTGNWQTTVVGALLGALNYLTQNGTKLPSNRSEWGAAGVSLALALLGALAKDSATGSQAK